MRDLAGLLADLRGRGVTIWPGGQCLRYRAPKGVLTPQLRQILTEHKAEILALFSNLGDESKGLADLLRWAAELAEQDMVLPHPVTFTEAPRRTMTTEKVSRYAAIYLRTVVLARTYQRSGGWHIFTREWWWGQEQAALEALAALRTVMDHQEGGQGSLE